MAKVSLCKNWKETSEWLLCTAGGRCSGKRITTRRNLKIDTGCIVAFTNTVSYDIQFVGGIKILFSEVKRLFLVQLQGPGKVWVQTLPISRLVL